MRKLTCTQVNEVVSRYLSGTSSDALARELAVSGQAIRGLLKRRGIARRTQSDAQRRYSCDHAFFATPGREEVAYWLGFIAADGSIKGRNEMRVSLASRDRDHLIRLAGALGSSHPVRNYVSAAGLPFSCLSIRSDQMCGDLRLHGIVPNKTFTLRWPTTIPTICYRHFLRGYVDGDGGFTATPSSGITPNLAFHVTSNQKFLSAVQRILAQECALGITKLYERRPGSGAWTLRYSGRHQMERIVGFLYEGASVCLPRKLSPLAPFLSARNIAWKYLAGIGMPDPGGQHVNLPIVGDVNHAFASAHKPPALAGGS